VGHFLPNTFFGGARMPYFVEAFIGDCKLTATAGTARKAFAEAIEWHIVRQFVGVSICHGGRKYSIAEFADAMALQEIADTMQLDGHSGFDGLESTRRPSPNRGRNSLLNRPYITK
jgi:hypothetical protein